MKHQGRAEISDLSPGVNDSEQEDVYSAKTYVDTASANNRVKHCSIHVTAENSPLTLSRIYGLLATLSIVPSVSRSMTVSGDELAAEFDFRDMSLSSIDRLRRKLFQMTEVSSVSALRIKQ